MLELDVRSPIPLHVQLKELIKREIGRGSYMEQIPSERELMEKYSVSRTTVREAISALVREGVLEKVHGKGTFISFKPIEEWSGRLQSFTETIRLMGMEPSAEMLQHGVIKAPKEVKTKLGLEEVYHIQRLQLANGKPVAIGYHYFPVEIGKKLMEHDINTADIYQLLESLGIILFEADVVIMSEMPTAEDARHLDIPPTVSVLTTERLTRDLDGNWVEYLKGVIRADMFAVRMNIARSHA